MRHWWLENPAMTDDWLLGYQLRINDTIQGVNLAIPLRVIVKGTPQQAALGTTWRVMSDHRAWSLALAHEVDKHYNDFLRFNGTPSPQILGLLKLSYFCHREAIPSSLFIAHPIALALKALKLTLTSSSLPKIILPENAPPLATIAASVDAAWLATSGEATGPMRDWRYWEWFSIQNPSVNCSTAILPAAPGTAAPPLCALLVDFGDGKLQMTDIWPASASINRIVALFNLILQHARRARLHTLLIPHLNPRVAAACAQKHPYRQGSEDAKLWTNSSTLPTECSDHYWPLHTGDALL